MNKFAAPLGAVLLLGFGLANRQADETLVVISGNALGHITPCGCTKPMSGGLSAMAAFIRSLKSQGNVIWLDTGAVVTSSSLQQQYKAEAYAELLKDVGVDVAVLSHKDKQLGLGTIAAMSSLLGKKFVGDSFGMEEFVDIRQTVGEISVTTDPEADATIYVGDTIDPHDHNELGVFASDGKPIVGTKRVSPGSHLRGVVLAKFNGKKLINVTSYNFPPTAKPDPAADAIYAWYQKRVRQSDIISKVAKTDPSDNIGSFNCKSCHTKIYKQHVTTKHFHAYETLKSVKSDADPECVGCHVTGLESKIGFQYKKTPGYEQVGCESCHGGGRAHAKSPFKVKLPKVGESSCIPCHTPQNSAGFNFTKYWAKIAH